MSYRWSLDGPAFEFQTPFATENRLLTIRGYALIVLAVVALLVLGFVHAAAPGEQQVFTVEQQAEPAPIAPFLVGSLFLALLGGLNLLQASRQRKLLLAPGRPASLAPEVPPEAAGASAAGAALIQTLERGAPPPAPLTGAYAGLLRRLGLDTDVAPSTLYQHLRQRIAHLLLLLGLLVLLVAVEIGGRALGKPGAAPLFALLAATAAVGAVAFQVLNPERAAPTAAWVVAQWLLLLAVGLPLAWFADQLPGIGRLIKLGLPLGVGVALLAALLFEAMALLAGRGHAVAPRLASVAMDEVNLALEASPARLFAEVERELLRRWAHGVPNRRYMRQPPVVDSSVDEGSFVAVLLEESQSLAPTDQVGPEPTVAPAGPPISGQGLLLALGVMGLACSIAGALLWVWTTRAHMLDPGAAWWPLSLAVLAVLAGGHALRLGHLLWSRVESASELTWIEFKGNYYVQPSTATPAPNLTRGPVDAALAVESMTLRARVAPLRSVFYAAGGFELGSRRLLAMGATRGGAQVWTQLAQGLERSAAADAAALSPAMQLLRAQAQARRVAERAAQPAAPRRPARFCSACGTPLLAGARFCQQCGSSVSTE